MNRRLREVVVVGLVIASLASVVVAAVHADADPDASSDDPEPDPAATTEESSR